MVNNPLEGNNVKSLLSKSPEQSERRSEVMDVLRIIEMGVTRLDLDLTDLPDLTFPDSDTRKAMEIRVRSVRDSAYARYEEMTGIARGEKEEAVKIKQRIRSSVDGLSTMWYGSNQFCNSEWRTAREAVSSGLLRRTLDFLARESAQLEYYINSGVRREMTPA